MKKSKLETQNPQLIGKMKSFSRMVTARYTPGPTRTNYMNYLKQIELEIKEGTLNTFDHIFEDFILNHYVENKDRNYWKQCYYG